MKEEAGLPPGMPPSWPYNPMPTGGGRAGECCQSKVGRTHRLAAGRQRPERSQFLSQSTLAELGSADVDRRRIAIMHLRGVPPKQLRDEIAKTLEALAPRLRCRGARRKA